MKNSFMMLLVFLFLLAGCSGSGTYRGSWKATDIQGRKFEINFEAKSFSVKDSSGKLNKYKYSQNSVQIEGAREQYRIKLGDRRQYYISFPNKDDETRGLIKDVDGNPIYAIGRDKYITYEEMVAL